MRKFTFSMALLVALMGCGSSPNSVTGNARLATSDPAETISLPPNPTPAESRKPEKPVTRTIPSIILEKHQQLADEIEQGACIKAIAKECYNPTQDPIDYAQKCAITITTRREENEQIFLLETTNIDSTDALLSPLNNLDPETFVDLVADITIMLAYWPIYAPGMFVTMAADRTVNNAIANSAVQDILASDTLCPEFQRELEANTPQFQQKNKSLQLQHQPTCPASRDNTFDGDDCSEVDWDN